MSHKELSTPGKDRGGRSAACVRVISLSVALAFLVMAGKPIHAATYHVDAVHGNDANPGTLQQPWKSISKAARSLVPGDAALIRGGTYQERVTVRVAGTAAQRIAISAYPGEKPILEGTVPIRNWTRCTATEPGLTVNGKMNPNYANIYRAQVSQQDIPDVTHMLLMENGEFLQIAQNPNQSSSEYDNVSQYITLTDGRNWGQAACLWDPTRLNQGDDYWNKAWVKVWSHAANNHILTKTIADFVSSEGKIVFDSALSAVLSNTAGSVPDAYSIANHPHIIDKPGEFYITTAPVNGMYTVYLWPRDVAHLEQSIGVSKLDTAFYFDTGFGSYVTLEGFEIRGYSGTPSWTGGVILGYNNPHTATHVRNCRIVNMRGMAGIWLASGTNDLVEGNTVQNIQEGRGIIINGGAVDGIVRGNIVSGVPDTGIYVPGSIRCQIVGNRIGGGGVHGNAIAIYQGASDTLVANNTITNSVRALTMQQSKNITLFNNVMHGNGNSVVADWGGCSGTVVVANNVIVGAPNNAPGLLLAAGPVQIVKNNVLCGGGGGDRSHNIYVSLNWNQTSSYGWYPAAGESIVRDQTLLFVDPANHDYRLKAGSPAINAGTAVDAYLPKTEFPNFNFGQDLAGTSRVAPPDIGAYEYGSGTAANQPPVLQPIGSRTATVNVLLSFSLAASDPEGKPLTFSASGLPTGATLSGQTFSWTPATGQAGSYQVTFTVSDGQAQDSETITITVGQPNAAPILTAIGSKSVNESQLLTFAVSATDADGDAITYAASGLPTGASLSGQTFTWTPTYEQAGSHNVTFTARDGQAQDSEIVTITVANVNRPPMLAAIGSKSVNETEALSFSLSATDPDADGLTYSAGTLPSGASFTGQTFAWTPMATQAGSYPVTFTVSDGQTQDTETITITVANVNRPPLLAAIGSKAGEETKALSFSISAADPDGDDLTYTADGLPNGAGFAGQDFAWTPAAGQAGSYPVTFTVSDGTLTDSETVTIAVASTAADRTPPAVAPFLPLADAVQVPLNNLVTLHITDAGSGVDANSVSIAVDGRTVYQGNVPTYTSDLGRCSRSGTEQDFRFIYQADEMFDFDQTVAIRVNATDRDGNVVSEYTYSFVTEMRGFGRNRPVGINGPAVQSGAVTACDATGNIWVAWHAGPAGSRDICVAKQPAGVEAFETPLRLTSDLADQCNPDLAVSAAGAVYVVWQDNRNGHWDLYAALSSDGVGFSPEVRVTSSDNNEIHPAIAVDRSAPVRAYVAWQDDRNGNQDIYVTDSTNGFAANTPSQVTTDGANQTEPDVAVDSSNVAYLVWTDSRNGQADLYGAASNAGPWTNVPVVTSAGEQTQPVIAAEPDSAVLHLLWVNGLDRASDIYYASSTGLPGTPAVGVNLVDDTSGAAQTAPALVCSANEVFACWTDSRHLDIDGTDTDLYMTEVRAGEARTNVFVGDDGANANQGDPSLGVDRHGQPYVVWTDHRSTAPAIYYAGTTVMDCQPQDSAEVVASVGATIGTAPTEIDSHEDVSIVVPAGACQADLRMTISKVVNPPISSTVLLSSYDFGPSGVSFNEPVTVTIPYRYAGSRRAKPYWYDSVTGALSQQGITEVRTIFVAPKLNALQFKTTHFTPFYLVAAEPQGASSGGGGCAISTPGNKSSPGQLLLPYVVIALLVAILRRRDRKQIRKGIRL